MGSILRKCLKTGGLSALFFLFASMGWAQGSEDFTNSNAGTGYGDGSFVGNNGITWTYVASRDGNGDANGSGINLPALMLRRTADDSKITSSEIPNGIGNFNVKLYKGFTGAGDRQVELFINGISQGTSTGFDDFNEHIFEVNNIDISGNIVIEIKNITSRQVIIDDITWTGFGGGGNTDPLITNIIQVPNSDNVTSADPVSVFADIIDVDGIASAELRWGTVSGNLGNTILMNLTTGDTYASDTPIPAQVDGTTVYYEIHATDANVEPATTISPEQSYTVADPIPLVLPYFNGLRNQDDYDEALDYGFGFNDATLVTTAGGYIKIVNGSIISPSIDFSLYDNLTVIFDMRTFGGNTGQELGISVSNDNGANYVLLSTIATPGDYETFSQLIDLSTLNGNNGRIKFEMTGGTNSIRFRDLSILPEFQGFFYSNGNWTPSDPNGISTPDDDLYIINGTASLIENADVRNITINAGATLKIENVLTIAGNIINNGNLLFVSTATGNGELGPVPSSSSITGNATVQRYMSDRNSFRMVSSAVTTTTSIHANWQEGATSSIDNPSPGFGTHITGSTIDQENGFDGTATGNPSMFHINYSNQELESIDNTDINTLVAGEPYLMQVRGDRSIDLTDASASSETILRATGALQAGTITQNWSTVNTRDFAMFGNPYQSTVDVNSLLENAVNLNPLYYYVYDPNLGEHGAFVTVNLTDGDGTNTSGSVANKFLQPGQAAQVATAAPGPSSVIFNESDKAPGNFTATNLQGNLMAADDMLTVQLYTADNYNADGPVHDSFGIVFADGNDDGLTIEDAVKPLNLYENLGIDHDGTLLSLEHREIPQPQPSDIYWLYSSGYQNSEYVLKLTLIGLDEVEVTLTDTFTDQTIGLSGQEETTYSFSVDANDPLSIATNRFYISVDEILGVNNNNFLSDISLYPNPMNGNTFQIKAPKLDGEKLSVNISDMTGRKIFNQTLECRDHVISVQMRDDLASGVYLVTLNHGDKAYTMRLIKE